MTALRPDGRRNANPTAEAVGWDDARLAAAFAARAALTPPTPTAVADEVLAVGTKRRGPFSGWPSLAVAAAALAILVVGASTILPQLEPSPSGPSGAGPGNPRGSGGAPNAVVDLGEPISVSAALAVGHSAQPDREIAVAGFLSPYRPIPCPYTPGPDNPTLLRCPATMQWLMEQLQDLWTASPNQVDGQIDAHSPTGPAFHPSFALVGQPSVARSDGGGSTTLSVVLIGHFHDRRAALCDEPNRQRCGETFVVDRVLSLNDEDQPVTTVRSPDAAPSMQEADVDALIARAAPSAVVESRQLLTVESLTGVEPVLANDSFVTSIADSSALVWLVTTVDMREGVPVARTFGLSDGSGWFAEITAAGPRPLDRDAPSPSGTTAPALPTADPAAFDNAPTSVLGIQVRDIASVEADRAVTQDALGRDELAIRAWYVAPDPAATCPAEVPAIQAPTPPCDEKRHWLLQDPQQYGVEPGQLRRDPSLDHYPPVLNPLLPVDVPFETAATWDGSTPTPRPVIVLGHFNDHRVETFAGELYFVIDALTWTPGSSSRSLDTVVRLTGDTTEDVPAVLARIEAVSPNDAVATWVTVADAGDFKALDRRAESMPEFESGPPVWMVARLVQSEMDTRQRLAVEWAWTADGGTRVWWTRCPDCSPDLGTTLDLHDRDGTTAVIHFYDYDQRVAAVDTADGRTGLRWRHPLGNAVDGMEVAYGRTTRELVVRLTGVECGSTLNVGVHDLGNGRLFVDPYVRGEVSCGTTVVVRRFVIELREPFDIDKVEGPSCCG